MDKEHWKAGNMIYPVPAVMVSCKRKNEKPNIITVAWCGTCCTNPPMAYVSIRPERYSYEIIKDTKEFVINLTTKDLAFATDFCGVKSGKDINKFEETGLTVQESQHIKAPGILESPVNIECKVREILPLGSHHMFLADVVGVTINKKYLDENNRFDLAKSNIIAYSHGQYFTMGELLGKFGYSVQKKK
ncbi:MAG: flavin reductase family protein [Erysipelotrichaceae bacterium]|nr:flavin reductase family protein [Erysipelotrichaceae bacterium]